MLTDIIKIKNSFKKGEVIGILDVEGKEFAKGCQTVQALNVSFL